MGIGFSVGSASWAALSCYRERSTLPACVLYRKQSRHTLPQTPKTQKPKTQTPKRPTGAGGRYVSPSRTSVAVVGVRLVADAESTGGTGNASEAAGRFTLVGGGRGGRSSACRSGPCPSNRTLCVHWAVSPALNARTVVERAKCSRWTGSDWDTARCSSSGFQGPGYDRRAAVPSAPGDLWHCHCDSDGLFRLIFYLSPPPRPFHRLSSCPPTPPLSACRLSLALSLSPSHSLCSFLLLSSSSNSRSLTLTLCVISHTHANTERERDGDPFP